LKKLLGEGKPSLVNILTKIRELTEKRTFSKEKGSQRKDFEGEDSVQRSQLSPCRRLAEIWNTTNGKIYREKKRKAKS